MIRMNLQTPQVLQRLAEEQIRAARIKSIGLGHVALGLGLAAVVGIGAYAAHRKGEARRTAARVNPGYKRAYGMPIDGGINATGDLTLALRGARHR